jgi:uncharacterized protein (DUF1015 family)
MGRTQPPPALLPFHGLRFRLADPSGTRPAQATGGGPPVLGGLSAVVGPPADIDSDDSARAFVRDRPYSAVRLEVSDTQGELRFAGARKLLARWRRDGILHTDPQPGYYLYEQEFGPADRRQVRRGLFGLVPLDSAAVTVLPHEGTWENNRDRRLQLLRALNASLSPIFLLYQPADNSLSELLAALSAGTPDASGSDDFGETHRLWRIGAPDTVAEIARRMRGQHFIIADGHHRFEAARLFHDEQQRPETGVILALAVATTDPGLLLLPFHRLIRRGPARPWPELLTRLEPWFTMYVQSVGTRSGTDLVAELGEGAMPTIGLLGASGADYAVLTLRSWEVLDRVTPADLPEPVRRLDAVTATELLLNRALVGGPEAEVDFLNDADEGLAAIRGGHADLALLLRPVRLDQVLAVARAGGLMPPKTTSFVPKVPIGLVMHDFQAERGT